MSVAIGTLLWRKSNAAHADHLHVEPPTKKSGTPPTVNPGMTPGIKTIYQALNAEFGQGYYFLDKNGRYVGNDPGVGWTHMGGWNRRKIAGSTTWSQHAWWNALDVGPYVGADQDKFYNFLKGINNEGEDMFTDKEVHELKAFVKEVLEEKSNMKFAEYIIKDIRKDIITRDELNAAIAAALAGVGSTSLKGKQLVLRVEDVR